MGLDLLTVMGIWGSIAVQNSHAYDSSADKSVFWWHTVAVSALPPGDPLVLYGPVLDWRVSWESSRLVLVGSPSVFEHYSDKAHTCCNAITDLLVFALVSFVGATCHGDFLSTTTDLRIAGDGLRVSVPMHDRFVQ